MQHLFTILKETVQEFIQSRTPELAAATSYFAILSIAPLLLVAILVVGLVFGTENAQGEIVQQLRLLAGDQVVNAIEPLFPSEGGIVRGSIVATIIGVVTLIIGSTRLFAQLQRSLNRMWGIRPDPKKMTPLTIAGKQSLTFVMVLLLGVMLVALILLDAVLLTVRQVITQFVTVPGLGTGFTIAETLLSLLLVAALFGLTYKILPDARVKWRDLWVGALVTSLLFGLGQALIGIYLRLNSTASAFGAAGSVIVLLLWVFFSAQVFFFGAQFTAVYARHFGDSIEPAPYAVRVPTLHEITQEEEEEVA